MKDQRQTRERSAIRAAFERADRPLSPIQALEAAQKSEKGLAIMTGTDIVTTNRESHRFGRRECRSVKPDADSKVRPVPSRSPYRGR
jgi:hypothetical protein